MPTQKKIDLVEEMRDQIERSSIAIATEYRGLSVTEMVALRRAIRQAGVEMKVVKNRLFLRAAEAAGKPELAQLLEGPTAVVFGYDDVVAPAKVTTEYQKSARNAFAVRSGVMNGQFLSAKDVESLASLPPREVLIGQFAGALISPVANLRGLLDSLLPRAPGRLFHDTFSTFNGLLEARAKQLEAA
jgi:large subunit ribosomal protein L10